MNWRKIASIALLLFGVVNLAMALWSERVELRAGLLGTPTTAEITRVTPAGRRSVLQGRYNVSNNPTSVEAYRLTFRFTVDGEVHEGGTVLDAYEIGNRFAGFSLINIRAPVGQQAAIHYLASDPQVSAIDHPLSFDDFWYFVMLGITALGIGVVLLFGKRKGVG